MSMTNAELKQLLDDFGKRLENRIDKQEKKIDILTAKVGVIDSRLSVLEDRSWKNNWGNAIPAAIGGIIVAAVGYIISTF